ncbi:transposase [Streptomyces sp. NRRL S-118]|uniref:transposase n=1 Tax=Streptomyces sp. NRRL S-118 TaxID=1463881 RepID=UPI000B1CC61A
MMAAVSADLSKRLVPDELWVLVAPLLPSFAARPQGGGTTPRDERAVFTAVVYVLTSGCAWRHLPDLSPQRIAPAQGGHRERCTALAAPGPVSGGGRTSPAPDTCECTGQQSAAGGSTRSGERFAASDRRLRIVAPHARKTR